ncbi:pantoate--beta-alanine ligase [Saccharospirillum sp. MSK14-1]|uniref:pantoate--beta-alanine ligase n=1 Tax=Saccharospirillum sp. MSK14-1 TaxID=1897632 RepID=UPI000D39AA32|nr:pantoate--beta-alanine ligase [Saccharospirillum sp. MSK14-1]PTY38635.1 pantoate--beta-alanine ligase [Saccharospirillum sp. MSK14-1]
MKTVDNLADLRASLAELRQGGKTVAFVPTMGNLHEGHMRLVTEARQNADIVVASIFVNPTQFGENEDLSGYPRTLEDDKKRLIAEGCQLLYTPSTADMYPQPDLTRVDVKHITTLHCGASRPGHFVGVATIVLKLFNQVQPDVAVFGLKDYQQFTVLKMMVENLFLPIRMIGVDTGRADDGLAHSSRNNYLTSDERERAPALYQILRDTAAAIEAGDSHFAQLTRQAKERLTEAGFTPDYFNISRRLDLEPAGDDDRELVILAAAFLGKARLIDNIQLDR